jgi:hypothetical protein
MRAAIAGPFFLVGTLMSSIALAQSVDAPVVDKKPSPVVSTVPASVNETVKEALDKQEITYSNVWADDKGKTHITKCMLKGLQFAAFAPPAAPYLYGIAPEDIQSIVFSIAPVGWYGTWHHAPGPQWVITLSGQWQVQTTDGSTLRQGPGEFQFNSDEASFSKVPGGHVGHTARQIGSVPNVRMIITLKKMPGQSYTNQACVL